MSSLYLYLLCCFWCFNRGTLQQSGRVMKFMFVKPKEKENLTNIESVLAQRVLQRSTVNIHTYIHTYEYPS